MDLRGDREESFYFWRKSIPVGVCRTHIPVYYDVERECIATEETPLHNLAIVSLLRIENREFPKPVFVSDQKYVYAAPPNEENYSFIMPIFPFADTKRKKNIENEK